MYWTLPLWVHRPHAEATPASHDQVAVRVHMCRAGRWCGAAQGPSSRCLTCRRSLTGHSLTHPSADLRWWLRAMGGPEWPLSTAKQEIVSGPSRQSRWTPPENPENASPQQPPGAPARCPAVLDGRGFGTGRPLGMRLGLGFCALGEAEPLLSDVGPRAEPAPGRQSAGPHPSPQGGALLFPCETWVWNRGSEGMFVARTERRGEEK